MSKERIDVFISSTSIDLPEHRAAVRDAILDMGFFPSGMENWPVTGENPVALCKKMVEDAELYIGIYAHRYGWQPDGYDGKSITELEYDWAGEVMRDGEPIPRLCFIMKDDYPWPKSRMELEAEEQLKGFKNRVKSIHAGFFGSPEDLRAQVTAALANYKVTRRSERAIEWEPGAHFDNYTLRKILGKGGNGEVWLADEKLPDEGTRQVAIKVLRTGISEKPERVERFKREISAMARIDHTHIVNIFTYGERAGQLYVIMPYMQGGTLRGQLTGEPLPLEEGLAWLEQIGAALDHVHDRHSGLIHRDVKPENMLISEDERTLKLADFGLVFSSDSEDERLTDEGKPAGTGRYMAPEQWRGKALSRHTDLYALGILAYELLTGHLPFQHKNDLELGNAHCEQTLPADSHLPDEILRILQKATAKHPDERYPTARAFLTDLRNWDVDPANLEPRIRDYLNWVTDELYESVRAQFIELKGDEMALRPQPKLRRAPTWEDDDDLFGRASASVEADHVPAETQAAQYVKNVRERLLTIDKVVLIGEPGSGKSWMLRRLQADYARAWLKGTGEGRGLIPVLVRLNEYTGGSFTDFVKGALDMLAPYHDRLLREKQLVILCDALNEMPRKNGQMRQLLAYLKNAPYFIVSCRVRDYRDDLGELKPLEQVLLRDLELPAIRELVQSRLPDEQGGALWEEMGGSKDLMDFWQERMKADHSTQFWDASTNWWNKAVFSVPSSWRQMHQGARLIPLARNPYMGDLLCRTYRESGGSLPASRAALFGQFISQMLAREAKAAARRGETFPEPTAIEVALIALAKALQDAGRTVIEWGDAQRLTTADLLDAATNANILASEGDSLKFAHQLLQEYFAAKILLEKMEADEHEGSHARAYEVFQPDWWDAGVWRETVVILGEFLGGAGGANRVLRWLASVTPEVALDVLWRNGAGYTVENDLEASSRAALISGAEALTTEDNPIGRAAAYRVLSILNADQRPGIGVIVGAQHAAPLPDIVWSEPISPGKYPIGGDEGAYQSFPAETYELDYSFRVAKYPVTNAQFQTFIDADEAGYNNPAYWTRAGLQWKGERRAPDEYSNPNFRLANHPRIYVCWYEAMAFCSWLTERYQQAGLIQVDEIIRLPQEKEWEIAARGEKGLFYPYGNEFDAGRGNTGETGISQTSAVGIFPDGASPYGVLDMSGNVWEWCLTDYSNPAEHPEKEDMHSNSRRVLRGGSWFNFLSYARGAFRGSFNPGDRGNVSGFRLVRAPSL